MANKVYRCLNCGASLQFNPKTQEWNCEYCDKAFNLSELEAAGKADLNDSRIEKGVDVEDTLKSTDGTEGDMVSYTCSHCGAQIITDKSTSATICVYCSNPVVLNEQLIGKFAPDKVIPFKLIKSDAEKKYVEFCKKPLTPKAFYNPANVKKITGVYIPFWLYDCKTDCDLTAEGRKVTTWRAGNYLYTKTDIYSVKRAGTLDFTDVPVDASQKTEDSAMDSIEPFNYDEMVPFSAPFLAGYLAERYDIEEQEAIDRINSRVKCTTKQEFMNTITGYNSVSVTNEEIKAEESGRIYALLPVWLLNTSYKGKDYLFAMNGQTGKMVGNLPIDKKRAFMYGLVSFIIALGGITLINAIINLF